MAFQKMEEEINELKEKLNILQNPPDTNQSERSVIFYNLFQFVMIFN